MSGREEVWELDEGDALRYRINSSIVEGWDTGDWQGGGFNECGGQSKGSSREVENSMSKGKIISHS